MNKLAKFVITIYLAGLPAAAQADTAGVLNRITGRTDTQLAESISSIMENNTFSVPEPDSPFKAPIYRAEKTPYLPLTMKMVYDYEYTSSEFIGAKTLRVEYTNLGNNAVNVTMTIFNRTNPKIQNYTIYADDNGIYASDSPLTGKRIEFPLPATLGRTWTDGDTKNKITTLTAKVSVPAGNYVNCLKVLSRLSGGDSGSSERFYAPGIGLIYENLVAEDEQETIRLMGYTVK